MRNRILANIHGCIDILYAYCYCYARLIIYYACKTDCVFVCVTNWMVKTRELEILI